jgi:hypothetical protein
MNTREQAVTKEVLKLFKEEIVHEFHVVSEGLSDQIKLVAEGHSGLVKKIDKLEKENERQYFSHHQE